MTKFLGIENYLDRGLVARLNSGTIDDVLYNEKQLRSRIAELRGDGLDTFVEKAALAELIEEQEKRQAERDNDGRLRDM